MLQQLEMYDADIVMLQVAGGSGDGLGLQLRVCLFTCCLCKYPSVVSSS